MAQHERKLVKHLAELTVGTKVVVVDCELCGSEHRGMVIAEGRVDNLCFADGLPIYGNPEAREVVPVPPCFPERGGFKCFIIGLMVDRRLVYRIDSGVNAFADAAQDICDERDARLRAAEAVLSTYTFEDGVMRVLRRQL